MLTAISCKKDWLEEKSNKALTIPLTLADFQGLIDNVGVINNQSPVVGEVASDGHYVTDAVYGSATKNNRTDSYIWSHTMKYRNVTDWNQSYAKVLIFNIVLEGLKKIDPIDAAENNSLNYIKGQALFNRSRVFFELCQIFTAPYNSATASKDLGIVLRLSTDITLKSERASLQQTYDQILKDLNEAKNILPARAEFPTRASKAAAAALLSRIYLTMGDYQNALLNANDCLNLYSQLLDFNTLPTNATVIGKYNAEVLFHSMMSPFAFVTSSCLIDPTLFNLYNVNDLRRSIYFRQNSDGTFSFKGNYFDLNNTPFGGIATDEVYLTRAECHARLGNVELAMKDLNTLMRTRWNKNVAFPTFEAISPEHALSQILEERRKELILRGIRWMDLRRLNKEPRFAITLTRTVAGTTYTLEPNSYKYAFPIPDDIIAQTGMEQNLEW